MSSSPEKKQKTIFEEPIPALNIKNEKAHELMNKEL